MIRAIYHNGAIRPIDDIPELSPEEVAELDDWVADMKAATAGITDEDHAQFMAALEEVERESKEWARREMESAG
jgi:hypothetical protein